jgi:hypothetical protein
MSSIFYKHYTCLYRQSDLDIHEISILNIVISHTNKKNISNQSNIGLYNILKNIMSFSKINKAMSALQKKGYLIAFGKTYNRKLQLSEKLLKLLDRTKNVIDEKLNDVSCEERDVSCEERDVSPQDNIIDNTNRSLIDNNPDVVVSDSFVEKKVLSARRENLENNEPNVPNDNFLEVIKAHIKSRQEKADVSFHHALNGVIKIIKTTGFKLPKGFKTKRQRALENDEIQRRLKLQEEYSRNKALKELGLLA